MVVEVFCNKSYSEVDGKVLIKNKYYKAEIIHDIIIIKAENKILISATDYTNNDWFAEHLALTKVIPLPKKKVS